MESKEIKNENREVKSEEKRTGFNYNFISVAILYIWALAFIFETGKIEEPDSRIFPYAVSAFAIFLATILLLSSIFGKRRYEEFDFSGTGKAVKYGIILVGYVILVALFGFYIATPIYMMVGMYSLGQRKIPLMVAVSVITPVIVYVFFQVLLKLQIPKGMFF
ncbi:tripartite tricarboxylate transporter TctB family protein [Peptoniphilus catoniae]|uniref:tripartite tricarboxylate transporter TctB family protein n=1 Tax=Peptoniphilus catoniae TaxID=1660341 RepID=UPI0010FE84E8|nr:tripartite tricarboxylate transporter TctB family protein [Peptoniphilus catoniae]